MSAIISHSFHFNMQPIVLTMCLDLDVLLNYATFKLCCVSVVIRRSIVRDLEG